MVNRKALAESNGNQNLEMSVEMEWEESGDTYRLKRTFEPLSQGIPAPRATLRINGDNPVPVSAIPAYVQRFLAKEISHFFFFDGVVESVGVASIASSTFGQQSINSVSKIAFTSSRKSLSAVW